MAEYRVYIVGLDGHFIKSIGLDCRSDEAAIEHAKQFVDGRDVEIWSGERPVMTLSKAKAGPPEPSSS
jgi:hypothetical protein